MRNEDNSHKDNLKDFDIVATYFHKHVLEVKRDSNKGYDSNHFMMLTLLLYHRQHKHQRKII